MFAPFVLSLFAVMTPAPVQSCQDHSDVTGDGYFTCYEGMPEWESCRREPSQGAGSIYTRALPTNQRVIGWIRGPIWFWAADATVQCESQASQTTRVVWVLEDPQAPMGCARVSAKARCVGRYQIDRGPARIQWDAETRVQCGLFEIHPDTGDREVAAILRFDAALNNSGKLQIEIGGMGSGLDSMGGSMKFGMGSHSDLTQVGEVPPVEDSQGVAKCTPGFSIVRKTRGYCSLAAGWNMPRVGRISCMDGTGESSYEFDSYGPCL